METNLNVKKLTSRLFCFSLLNSVQLFETFLGFSNLCLNLFIYCPINSDEIKKTPGIIELVYCMYIIYVL